MAPILAKAIALAMWRQHGKTRRWPSATGQRPPRQRRALFARGGRRWPMVGMLKKGLPAFVLSAGKSSAFPYPPKPTAPIPPDQKGPRQAGAFGRRREELRLTVEKGLVAGWACARQQNFVDDMDHAIVGHNISHHDIGAGARAVCNGHAIGCAGDAQALRGEHRLERG